MLRPAQLRLQLQGLVELDELLAVRKF